MGWQPCRPQQTKPGHSLKTLVAGLGHRGHLWQIVGAFGGRHRQGAQLAALDVAQQGGHRRDIDLDQAPDHIGQALRRAFVGHMGEFDARFTLEHFGGQVGHGAVARGGVVQSARLRFGGGHRIGQGLVGRIGRDHQSQRGAADQAEWGQVVDGVVGQFAVQGGVDGEVAGLTDHQVVAIGRGFGDGVDAEVAARARLVVHNEAPLRGRCELVADIAGHNVRAATGRERHDQAYGLGRPALCQAQPGCAGCQDGEGGMAALDRLRHRFVSKFFECSGL